MMFRHPPRKRLIVLGIVGTLLIAVTLVGSVLWSRWHAVPEYWKQHAQYLADTPPEQLEALAHQVEVRLLPQWSAPVRAGGDGVRTISVSFEEVNAWLAAKLDGYLRNQGVRRPDGLEAVMVTQRDGQLVLAASIDRPKFQQILSIYIEFLNIPPGSTPTPGSTPGSTAAPENFPASPSRGLHSEATKPRITPDGARISPEGSPEDAASPRVGWKVARIVGGRLTLPGGVFAEQVRDTVTIKDAGAQAILDAIAQDRSMPMPLLPIDGTREARVLAVQVRPDGVDVTLRVQMRGP